MVHDFNLTVTSSW